MPRKHTPFDPSVLGYTETELEEMDDEERAEALRDCLNRAADLLQAIPSAFPTLKGSDRDTVKSAAKEIIRVARLIDIGS